MNDKIGYASAAFQAALATVQLDQVFQIVMFILSILTAVVTLLFNIWKWYKSAKEDNKITVDEIREGIDIIKEDISGIIDSVEDFKENKDKKE